MRKRAIDILNELLDSPKGNRERLDEQTQSKERPTKAEILKGGGANVNKDNGKAIMWLKSMKL